MSDLLLSEPIRNALVEYLADRPYRETAGLIQALATLPPGRAVPEKRPPADLPRPTSGAERQASREEGTP